MYRSGSKKKTYWINELNEKNVQGWIKEKDTSELVEKKQDQ